MKFASYLVRGEPSFGAVIDGGIVDLKKRLGAQLSSLRSVLAQDALDGARAATLQQQPDYRLDEVQLRPVIPDPEKILCVGLNYHSHRQETGRPETEFPSLFVRFASTQIGNGQPLIRPKVAQDFDYEAELAVIIGKRGRYVAKDSALEHVAGYACFHDATLRDWQRHTSQWTPGKNFPGTGGLGPWLVTTDEIPDPTQLTVVMRLNGKEMQHATTDLMIFSVPTLIQYISSFTELVPGDVIATGTPGGVGFKRTPPVFMKPGDVAEVEVTGVGVLRNAVIAEQ
ncbi:MAG TPA: fumarylacetoacetate hydrolase family protein [Myxococcaceae bacterium]|nr:fumarylacetoacetate hydrolase family protein [Myxococcaceae bacterium]